MGEEPLPFPPLVIPNKCFASQSLNITCLEVLVPKERRLPPEVITMISLNRKLRLLPDHCGLLGQNGSFCTD